MSSELLQAVLDRPHDDAPRRAYADALGAHPHAEFIRSQLDNGGGSMPLRERELLREHRRTWLGDLAGIVEQASFSRGFVGAVTVDAPRFVKRADTLFAAAPIVDLVLTNAEGRHDVFRVRHLTRLRSLVMTGGMTDRDAVELGACAHLTGLRLLDLRDNRIGRVGLNAIASSPYLRNLQVLAFAGNLIEDPCPVPVGAPPDERWDTGEIHAALVEKHGALPWLVRRARGIPSPAAL